MRHRDGGGVSRLQREIPQPALHQDVVAATQQPDHHRLHADLHQHRVPRPGFGPVQHRRLPLHLHGTRVDANGRFLTRVRRHVQQNVARPFHFHRRQIEQENHQRLQAFHGGGGSVVHRSSHHDDVASGRSVLQGDQTTGALREPKSAIYVVRR